ncbi:hypothetical protein ACFE04_025808 [Oxalis oulophora]
MGCGTSKIDDLPLVTLCRERKDLIKAASNHRYALAAAHVAYFHSLKDIGDAIKKFVDEELVISASASTSAPDSPILRLPTQGKGKHKAAEEDDDDDEDDEGSHLHISDSDLDSLSSGHIHIPSDDDDDDEDDDGDEHDHDDHKHHHNHDDSGRPGISHYQGEFTYGDYNYNNGNSSNDNNYGSYPPQEENWGSPPTGYAGYPPPQQANWGSTDATGYSYPSQSQANWGSPAAAGYRYNVNYMRKAPTQSNSFIYDEPPRYNTASSSNSGYGYPPNYPQNGGSYEFPMMDSYGYGQPPPRQPSPPKPPPPPPPPPSVSNWDFLNFFDSYNEDTLPAYYTQRKYGSTTSSPDSKEVREREGIPDLEDETENEVLRREVKKKKTGEMETNYKRHSGEGPSTSKAVHFQSEAPEKSRKLPESSTNKGKDTISSYSSPDTIVTTSEERSVKEGHVFEVDSNDAVDVESSKTSSLTTLSVHGSRDLREAVNEIRDEFETASTYGKEVAALLEVARLPYLRRTNPLKVVFSRILYLIAPDLYPSQDSLEPSIQLSPRTIKLAKAYTTEPEKDFNMMSGNLSLTLEKLYAWEKKLYKEVKDEERLRVSYEKQCRKLKTLFQDGAESSKIEATQASIKRLMTKIDICIRAVDSISSRIHQLRDEELQPQLSELIHGLTRMWKAMLKCHQKQFKAIMESKFRSLKANTGLQSDAGVKATAELERELLIWCDRFNHWVKTQKCYAETLNEWLVKCILPEPEITADGVAPFSPGRIGAPPIFVICNDWCQSMLALSEKGVGNAMHAFASNLHELWERQDQEQKLRKGFEKGLSTIRMETGRNEKDTLSVKSAVSKKSLESGVSPLDDLKVDLDSMRKNLEEERLRHKEAIKLVHSAASKSLQGGLVPIFEALGNFTSEVVKAHEQVRLQN